MVTVNGQLPDDLFAAAVIQHNLGVDGNREAAQKAQKMFEKICADNPADCLAEAYLGSATALLGRDEIDPDKRLKLALKGLKILDRAVAKAPDHIDIRILRGFVCHRLPEMIFHRLRTAVEDFDYLVNRYEKNEKLFSRDLYWKILFELGKAYKGLNRPEEAQATWAKLMSAGAAGYEELLRQEGFVYRRRMKK